MNNENEYKCENCNVISKNVVLRIDENKKEESEKLKKYNEKRQKDYKIEEKEYKKIVEDHNNEIIKKHWYQKYKSIWIFESSCGYFHITKNGKEITDYPRISINHRYLDLRYGYIECPVCKHKHYILV